MDGLAVAQKGKNERGLAIRSPLEEEFIRL
jgi:hypothetical protein